MVLLAAAKVEVGWMGGVIGSEASIDSTVGGESFNSRSREVSQERKSMRPGREQMEWCKTASES